MGLIELLIVLVLVGVLLWAINTFIPLDPKIRQIINIVVVIVVVLWLLAIFVPGIGDIRVRPLDVD